MSQSYKKSCTFCNTEIVMDMVGGKWLPYNLAGTFHECSKQPAIAPQKNGNIQVQQKTLEDRVKRLEAVLEAILLTGAHKE